MRKKDEIAIQDSCLNKADDNEWLFVLLGRDPAAADTIRYWALKRIGLGINEETDAKIVQANRLADEIDREHAAKGRS